MSRYARLAPRLAEVRERIAFHQARGGWHHQVRIVGVTKGHSVDAIRAAAQAELHHVGENRVQEALRKQSELDDPAVRWHLIGPLQRNKVRQLVGRFELIHSVDRPALVAELAKRVGPTGQSVLVEVNCSDEPQKAGVPPASLVPLVEAILSTGSLRFEGLMTMAALTEDPQVQRAAFGRLRALKETLETAGFPVRELSMGMSGDFPVAVEEGATIVRLGTVLFGQR